MGGPRDGGGRTKVHGYVNRFGSKMSLNREENIVARALDALPIKWDRNRIGFLYVNLDGVARKYYPDFYVEDFDCFVEYKGWVTAEMTHKMNDAVQKNSFRLIVIYSKDRRYRHLSNLNIKTVSEAPELLLQELAG